MIMNVFLRMWSVLRCETSTHQDDGDTHNHRLIFGVGTQTGHATLVVSKKNNRVQSDVFLQVRPLKRGQLHASNLRDKYRYRCANHDKTHEHTRQLVECTSDGEFLHFLPPSVLFVTITRLPPRF